MTNILSMQKPLSKWEGSVVTVHINPWGEIDLAQREKHPQGLYSNYPDWMIERVAFIKMANEEDGHVNENLKVVKVNASYFMMWVNRSELIQLGKLIRKQNGTNA